MPTRHASITTKTKNSSGERHSYRIHQALCTSAYVPLHTQPPRLEYDYNATWLTFTINYTKPPLLLLSSNSTIAYLLIDHHAPQSCTNPQRCCHLHPSTQEPLSTHPQWHCHLLPLRKISISDSERSWKGSHTPSSRTFPGRLRAFIPFPLRYVRELLREQIRPRL
jgi:hypothetical protein